MTLLIITIIVDIIITTIIIIIIIISSRFLWTSGLIVDKEWIPWDLQIINAAPSIVQWTKV
jgi:hypothetical protein